VPKKVRRPAMANEIISPPTLVNLDGRRTIGDLVMKRQTPNGEMQGEESRSHSFLAGRSSLLYARTRQKCPRVRGPRRSALDTRGV
jgi:hypothetical protein